MIGFLIRLGLGSRAAKIIGYIVIPALIILIVWWAIEAYGARRYRAGVADTDAKWHEASRRLQEQAKQSAARADDAAADRLQQFENQVAEERRELHEAAASGSSPLDVLFGR